MSKTDKKGNRSARKLRLPGARRLFEQLPYIYFIGFLTLVYIANVHRAERKVRTIHKLQNELKESRWTYTSMMSEVMYEGTRSRTEERVRPLGLESLKSAPKVLGITEEDEP